MLVLVRHWIVPAINFEQLLVRHNSLVYEIFGRRSYIGVLNWRVFARRWYTTLNYALGCRYHLLFGFLHVFYLVREGDGLLARAVLRGAARLISLPCNILTLRRVCEQDTVVLAFDPLAWRRGPPLLLQTVGLRQLYLPLKDYLSTVNVIATLAHHIFSTAGD